MKRVANLCVAAVLAALAVACGCGNREAADRPPMLTPDQKIALGRAAVPILERNYGGRLDQPAVQAYVRTVGERIARSVAGSAWPYQFSVLESRKAGAFALPGGQIYVTQGLLVCLETEGELAGLLAHELAHVTAGHVEQRIRYETLAAAAKAAANGRDPKLVESAVALMIEMQYLPAMESEADRLGLDYMVAAGYHPNEMLRLMERWAALVGPDAGGFAAVHARAASAAGDVRDAIARKYPDQGGRVGRQEFQREVLDRLKTN